MRTLILASAALLCGTSAMAQVNITTTDANGTATQGPTTKVLQLGDHYTVHQVMSDGTVLVKTMTGKEAELAMKNGSTPQLALADTSGGMTTGAAATDPAAPNVRGDLDTTLAVAPAMAAPAAPVTTQKTTVSGSTRTTTTVQVVPKAVPAPAPMTTGAGAQPAGERG